MNIKHFLSKVSDNKSIIIPFVAGYVVLSVIDAVVAKKVNIDGQAILDQDDYELNLEPDEETSDEVISDSEESN